MQNAYTVQELSDCYFESINDQHPQLHMLQENSPRTPGRIREDFILWFAGFASAVTMTGGQLPSVGTVLEAVTESFESKARIAA